MLNPRDHSYRWTLLFAGALALGVTACSSDDGGEDAGADAGVDSGVSFDATVVDSGTPDAGFPDSGPAPDAGHYCTMNGEVDVDGTGVPVADVSQTPVTVSNLTGTEMPAVLSCIDDPPSDNPPFINELCFAECVSFMGASPTQAEIDALEVTVFAQTMGGQPVDPSYDYVTGADRQPEARTGAGFDFVQNSQDCDSGWQLEIGYSNLGQVLAAETRYIVRVRTATTANADWPTVYMYNFIRRNDEVEDANCGNDEPRTAGRRFEFPIVPASLLSSAVTAAGGNVVGADDLGDGLGSGHAILEARDCAGGSGLTMEHVTGGFDTANAGAFYVGDDYSVSATPTETGALGLLLAVGFDGNTATSSSTIDVVAAVGASTDGTCTEEFGGIRMPVFSDGVTFVRMNRETVLHED